MVKQTEALNHVFGALADPTRRAIVGTLSKQHELPLSVLAEPFAMSLPAVSKHVTVLEDAGVVRRRKAGRQQLCSLNPKTLEQSITWLLDHQAFWNTSFDRLEAHLQTKK